MRIIKEARLKYIKCRCRCMDLTLLRFDFAGILAGIYFLEGGIYCHLWVLTFVSSGLTTLGIHLLQLFGIQFNEITTGPEGMKIFMTVTK